MTVRLPTAFELDTLRRVAEKRRLHGTRNETVAWTAARDRLRWLGLLDDTGVTFRGRCALAVVNPDATADDVTDAMGRTQAEREVAAGLGKAVRDAVREVTPIGTYDRLDVRHRGRVRVEPAKPHGLKCSACGAYGNALVPAEIVGKGVAYIVTDDPLGEEIP